MRKNYQVKNTEITDADIEAWALKEVIKDLQPRRYVSASYGAYQKGLIRGAKATKTGITQHLMGLVD